jgi:hypothetical protein
MFNRFKTADEVFFKSFEEAADILYQGALLLQDMMSNHDALEEGLKELICLEQKAQ